MAASKASRRENHKLVDCTVQNNKGRELQEQRRAAKAEGFLPVESSLAFLLSVTTNSSPPGYVHPPPSPRRVNLCSLSKPMKESELSLSIPQGSSTVPGPNPHSHPPDRPAPGPTAEH